MPKGKRGSRGKKRRSERLVYKQTARFRNPALFAGENLAEVAKHAWARYLETGEQTRGVELIGSWKNPNNKNPLHANWKRSTDRKQSLEGFRRTILDRVGAGAEQLNLFEAPTKKAVKAVTAAVAEKRSAAARRGAETRAKKQAAVALAKAKEHEQRKRESPAGKKRSAAAKKGWQTRKARLV
jgi:hypothetical protein